MLGEIPNQELYRAAVTMMMRLVFLFVAEERRLLPLDDPLYAGSYAASTLREQLEERATRFGEDPLERSSAAWYRLLALSRAVHGGIDHEALRLPAYGGGLFDPDRYPFLEGRNAGTGWRDDTAAPLPVDDRTVLHLLSALQVLTEPGRIGQPPTSVRLSFRALDVEQIGHVYEGLLDHTAVRTFDAALGLVGSLEAEVSLKRLENARAQGDEQLMALVKDETRKSPAAITKALAATPDPDRVAKLLAVCDNDPELRDRVLPFLGLVRDDLRDNPRVFLPGALYVTSAGDRRASGTYYTPRSLAEEVVRHALDPVAYSPGPADEHDPAQWKLKSPDELLALNVADIAMGSGAFLVAACRYLAARLLEAWDERAVRKPDGPSGAPPHPSAQATLPVDPLERDVLAHRLVAERCLYGVDRNPMAVEMAKLSLWLVTLAKDRPFSFLDHALREGDSLLGVTSVEQVKALHMDPARGRALHARLRPIAPDVDGAVDRALELRDELESFVVRDVRDSQRKADLHAQATAALNDARLFADVVVGAALANGDGADLDDAIASVESYVPAALDVDASLASRTLALQALRDASQRWLQSGRVDVAVDRRCFHWALELPEVWRRGGFDAIVGNPPFQGGKRITGTLGTSYREYVVSWLANGRRGSADLVAYFVLRAADALRPDGVAGLLATNTLGQGDTREVCLDALASTGITFIRANASEPWPGGASLEVTHLWLRRGDWATPAVLDGQPVRAIGPSLRPSSRVTGTPQPLMTGTKRSYVGCFVNGAGFVLTPEEASELLTFDPKNAQVVRPYLNGEDLNSRPDASPSRWVIDFRDWSLEEAERYPACIAIVRERVMPVRAKVNRAAHREYWWRFGDTRMALRREISGIERAIVLTSVSKVVQPMFAPTSTVFSHMLVVFAYDDDAHFGLLSSGFHWSWATARASTLETRVRYTPSDCFDTFVQPDLSAEIAELGKSLEGYRRPLMIERNEGLTQTYNRVHSAGEQSTDIRRLRAIHVDLDYAVRDAYGWTDLDLAHDFHETRYGTRYGFEGTVRQEILDRLLELNQQRYAEEKNVKMRPGQSATPRNPSSSQTTIFDDA